MQRCGNLVDLEKRCKMRPWTQKSALIQLRTSLLKFDDLAEKFERSSVSNFSTKVWNLTWDEAAGRVFSAAGEGFPGAGFWAEPPLAVQWPVDRAELMTVGAVLGWYRQTLDGSFSAVSKPIFATKASFCSIFRDLQENHLLASKFCKILAKFCQNFSKILAKFSQNFGKILAKSFKF